MGDAFAPWHIIILVVVLVVLFGAKRLPGAARSLGQSMHIFKQSVSGLHDGDDAPAARVRARPAARCRRCSRPRLRSRRRHPDMTQQQLADLQRQVADLQARSAAGNGQPAETQTSQPL